MRNFVTATARLPAGGRAECTRQTRCELDTGKRTKGKGTAHCHTRGFTGGRAFIADAAVDGSDSDCLEDEGLSDLERDEAEAASSFIDDGSQSSKGACIPGTHTRGWILGDAYSGVHPRGRILADAYSLGEAYSGRHTRGGILGEAYSGSHPRGGILGEACSGRHARGGVLGDAYSGRHTRGCTLGAHTRGCCLDTSLNPTGGTGRGGTNGGDYG